jgi:hypothetical protein
MLSRSAKALQVVRRLQDQDIERTFPKIPAEVTKIAGEQMGCLEVMEVVILPLLGRLLPLFVPKDRYPHEVPGPWIP